MQNDSQSPTNIQVNCECSPAGGHHVRAEGIRSEPNSQLPSAISTP